MTLNIVPCRHCDAGYRHVVGNCVVCGYGPAPGSVNFHGEPMPATDAEKEIVVWKLFKGIEPPTLDGKNYPTERQVRDFMANKMVSETVARWEVLRRESQDGTGTR